MDIEIKTLEKEIDFDRERKRRSERKKECVMQCVYRICTLYIKQKNHIARDKSKSKERGSV